MGRWRNTTVGWHHQFTWVLRAATDYRQTYAMGVTNIFEEFLFGAGIGFQSRQADIAEGAAIPKHRSLSETSTQSFRSTLLSQLRISAWLATKAANAGRERMFRC